MKVDFFRLYTGDCMAKRLHKRRVNIFESSIPLRSITLSKIFNNYVSLPALLILTNPYLIGGIVACMTFYIREIILSRSTYHIIYVKYKSTLFMR